MKPSLTNIISEENQRLEIELTVKAREIIRKISNEQEAIQRSNEKIAELRRELQSLETKELDAAAILGTPAARPL